MGLFGDDAVWYVTEPTVFQEVRYRQRLGNGEGTGMGIGKHIPHLELLVTVKGGVIVLR